MKYKTISLAFAFSLALHYYTAIGWIILCHFLIQSEVIKTTTNCNSLSKHFFCALCQLHVLGLSFDWFTRLSMCSLWLARVILWFWFFDTQLKTDILVPVNDIGLRGLHNMTWMQTCMMSVDTDLLLTHCKHNSNVTDIWTYLSCIDDCGCVWLRIVPTHSSTGLMVRYKLAKRANH